MSEIIVIQEISDDITVVVVEQQLDNVQKIVMQDVVERIVDTTDHQTMGIDGGVIF